MAARVTISKTSDGWFRAVVTEKYSTPWYYGETPTQALQGAPEEIKKNVELVEALITRPEAVEMVIRDYGTMFTVDYVYGQYRRVIPKSAPALEAALTGLLKDVEKSNK